MNIMIDNTKDHKYDLNGYIYFNDDHGNSYKMTARTALDIAYTLFDSVGHSYKELDEIDDELI